MRVQAMTLDTLTVDTYNFAASVVFTEIKKSGRQITPESLPSVVILCTTGTKSCFGLRAGALLVNHGASCTAFVPQTDQQLPPAFEFQLRLFSAAGGKVARSADGMKLVSSNQNSPAEMSHFVDLPENADIILDALSDNETGAKRNRYDTAIAESISWTLSCTPMGSDHKTHILSIDLPSNTDPDTGMPDSAISFRPSSHRSFHRLPRYRSHLEYQPQSSHFFGPRQSAFSHSSVRFVPSGYRPATCKLITNSPWKEET